MVYKKIEQATLCLLKDSGYNFYGHLLMRCKRHITKKVPTMGVNVKGGRINLYINEQFVNGLSVKEIAGVLKHEMDHVVDRHLFEKPSTNKNIAMDCAINQTNHMLPEMAVTLEHLSEKIEKNLKPHETWVYYYNHIQEFAKDNPDKCQLENGVDDHSVWEQGDSKIIAEQVCKDEVRKASSRASNVSGKLQLRINELLKSEVNWKRQIRLFAAKQLSIARQKTRKKVNRRLGYLVSGSRRKYELNLVCAIDTSGSVSDNLLRQFWAELNKIAENNAKITVIEADADIQNVYEFDKKKIPGMMGRGGTAYQPVFDYVKDKKIACDGLIYFGDGDCFDMPSKPNDYPVMWAIEEGRKPPVNWGKHIIIKEDLL
jgi:predicted metal-dependent peptidase